MFGEFKEFIQKGNVLDFAVAVIMATAFGLVVTSFTQDIVMPPVGMLLGGVDFADLKLVLQDAAVNADGTVAAEEVAIRWGKFVNFLINFIIVAFVMFLVVKGYNKYNAAEEAEAGPTAEDLLAEIRDALKK